MMQDLNKRIALSIDPGYDGTKTTVNGVTFTIPHDTVEKRGKEYDSCRDLEDIYQIETAAGTYLLGPGISALIGTRDSVKPLCKAIITHIFQQMNFMQILWPALPLDLSRQQKKTCVI